MDIRLMSASDGFPELPAAALALRLLFLPGVKTVNHMSLKICEIGLSLRRSFSSTLHENHPTGDGRFGVTLERLTAKGRAVSLARPLPLALPTPSAASGRRDCPPP